MYHLMDLTILKVIILQVITAGVIPEAEMEIKNPVLNNSERVC
ncbi:hypothetical protein [Desulfosporosinus lacus]|nr:hypothetical protein [Desulfosporosinus lacus]